MDLYLKSKHLRGVTDLLKVPQGNDQKEVDIEWFKGLSGFPILAWLFGLI